MNRPYRFNEQRKRRKNLLNIIVIISSMITCLRLLFWGILSLKAAILILVGIVIFLAIGNIYSKLILTGIALYLFISIITRRDPEAFTATLYSFLALLIVLLGIYVIVKGMFRKGS